MNSQKKNTGLYVLIVILCILVLALEGYIVDDKFIVKTNNNEIKNNVNNNDNTTVTTENNNYKINQSDETSIENINIKNDEVKELYQYVESSLNSNHVCLGDFFQNPYKNHDLTDKISLVLINYAEKYMKKMNNSILSKLPGEANSYLVKDGGDTYYIDANTVREGLKLIFNIDATEFDPNNEEYSAKYFKEADIFIPIMGGGNYLAYIEQQIIDYNELDDEINLTVVKAEIVSDESTFDVYRYVNKEETLVYKGLSDDFIFTKENINKFPQLKYIFKKNSNGKYYVSDIINLNFEQDFEEYCEY